MPMGHSQRLAMDPKAAAKTRSRIAAAALGPTERNWRLERARPDRRRGPDLKGAAETLEAELTNARQRRWLARVGVDRHKCAAGCDPAGGSRSGQNPRHAIQQERASGGKRA